MFHAQTRLKICKFKQNRYNFATVALKVLSVCRPLFLIKAGVCRGACPFGAEPLKVRYFLPFSSYQNMSFLFSRDYKKRESIVD